MGWAVGFDKVWNRDIGYGVPCTCDHPECNDKIDRGLSHVCGGEPFGGDEGCGLYFCSSHLTYAEGKEHQVCERCASEQHLFNPKPDLPEWVSHKLTDKTWQRWRDENPAEVAALQKSLTSK